MTETKELIPYDFQKEVINHAIMQVKKSSKRSCFVVSPPGSGKTLMMAEIMKQFTQRKRHVLFFVHRTEIVEQAVKTFKRQGVDLQYVKTGMVQTFRNREDELKEFNPQIIFVDEAHHSASPSYMKILNWFPKAIKFFFTATPSRADGKGFEELVNNDDIVLGPSVNWLIEHHYLSDFDYYIKTLYDTQKLNIRKGDYSNKSIEQQAKNVDISQIVQLYQQLGNNLPGLVYAGSVAQSKLIVNEFNKNGIKAVHLDGSSDPEFRKQSIQDYRDGKIKIISNVQIFTEGLDLPNAAVAMIVRPTRSIALFYQLSMRVLRYQEGKRAKIIDFAGVANNLGLPNADRDWSLLSRDVEQDVNNSRHPYLFTCPTCKEAFSSQQVIKEVSQDKNVITLKIICPKDHTVIKTKQSSLEGSELIEIQEILDKKEFSQEWYKTAEISRNQSLLTNARIILAQNNGIDHYELFVKLLNLYLPNFSTRTRYTKVLSIHGFPDEEINKMLSFINNGKYDKYEKDDFISMFNKRKEIVISTYIQNINLMEVSSTKDFTRLFRLDVQSIKKQLDEFHDYGNHNGITKEDILDKLAYQLVNNGKYSSKDFKEMFTNFCENAYKNNLLDKDEIDYLSKKVI